MSDKRPNLSKSRDWSEFLIRKTQGAFITLDHRGLITEFNPAAERLTGYSRDEAMGRLADEILHLQSVDLGIWNQVLKGEKEVTCDWLRDKDLRPPSLFKQPGLQPRPQ